MTTNQQVTLFGDSSLFWGSFYTTCIALLCPEAVCWPTIGLGCALVGRGVYYRWFAKEE
jgi:hypothetical protein